MTLPSNIPAARTAVGEIQPERVTPSSPLAPTAVGPYRLERLLGRGGSADVYLASTAMRQNPVAIKLLSAPAHDGLFNQLRRHVTRCSALKSPRVRTVRSVGRDDDRLYLVMEYIPGCRLDESVARHPLPAQALARQLVEGLAAAEAAGFRHGDVSPRNTLVTEQGTVHLIDFAGEDPHPGATPNYAAPERLRDHQPTAASDLFSLGRTLAFATDDAQLGPVIERLTRREPAERFQNYRQVSDALDRAFGCG